MEARLGNAPQSRDAAAGGNPARRGPKTGVDELDRTDAGAAGGGRRAQSGPRAAPAAHGSAIQRDRRRSVRVAAAHRLLRSAAEWRRDAGDGSLCPAPAVSGTARASAARPCGPWVRLDGGIADAAALPDGEIPRCGG